MQQEEEQLVLVDTSDNVIGTAGKMLAHQQGLLHRAVSVFIVNNDGKMLLQKRATTKYHCAGLWSNACCTHPRVGETYAQCATRRVEEELGFKATLYSAFSFIYKEDMENGLIEHELDFVFVGRYNGTINLNLDEAEECTFASLEDIAKRIEEHPREFTIWFRAIFNRVSEHLTGMESHLKGGVE